MPHELLLQKDTLAAAVFQPPEGAALSGPAATAPACPGVAGGVTRVMLGVDVVAAVVAVAPMGAPGVAGDAATGATGVATGATGAAHREASAKAFCDTDVRMTHICLSQHEVSSEYT